MKVGLRTPSGKTVRLEELGPEGLVALRKAQDSHIYYRASVKLATCQLITTGFLLLVMRFDPVNVFIGALGTSVVLAALDGLRARTTSRAFEKTIGKLK